MKTKTYEHKFYLITIKDLLKTKITWFFSIFLFIVLLLFAIFSIKTYGNPQKNMFKIISFYQQLLLILYLPLVAFYSAYITIKIYRQQIDNGIFLVYTSLPLSKTKISFYKILGLISFLIVINLFLLVISGFFAVINGKEYFNVLMLDVIKSWPLISIFLCAFVSLVFLISVWCGSKLTILLSSILIFICAISMVMLPMLQVMKDSQHPYYNFSQDEKFKDGLNNANLTSNFIGKDLFNIEDIKYLYNNGVFSFRPHLLDDKNPFTFSLFDRTTKSDINLKTWFNNLTNISDSAQTLIDILENPSSTTSSIFLKVNNNFTASFKTTNYFKKINQQLNNQYSSFVYSDTSSPEFNQNTYDEENDVINNITNTSYKNQLNNDKDKWESKTNSLKKYDFNYQLDYRDFAVILWTIYHQLGSTTTLDDIKTNLTDTQFHTKINVIGNLNIFNYILDKTIEYTKPHEYKNSWKQSQYPNLYTDIKKSMKSNWTSFAINPLMNVATSLLMIPINDNKNNNNISITIISSPTLVYPYTYDINNIYELSNDIVLVTSPKQKPIISIYGVGATYLIISLLLFTISFVFIRRKDVS